MSAQSTPEASSYPELVRGYVLANNRLSDSDTLWTIRLSLPPGTELPHWTRPNFTTIYVESGVLIFTGVTGRAHLTRGVVPVEHGSTNTGEFTRLEAGDTVSVNRGIQHSLFNPVTQPTVLIISTVASDGKIPFDGLWSAEGLPIVVEPMTYRE